MRRGEKKNRGRERGKTSTCVENPVLYQKGGVKGTHRRSEKRRGRKGEGEQSKDSKKEDLGGAVRRKKKGSEEKVGKGGKKKNHGPDWLSGTDFKENKGTIKKGGDGTGKVHVENFPT